MAEVEPSTNVHYRQPWYPSVASRVRGVGLQDIHATRAVQISYGALCVRILLASAARRMTSSRWPQLHASLRQHPGELQTWRDFEDQANQMIRQQIPDLDHGAAQDAVDQLCIQMAADLGKAHGSETFQGVVAGQLLTIRRPIRPRAQIGRSEVPASGFSVASPAAEDPGELALALLSQCLETLPQRERRAVELRFFQQASLAEMATALAVPEGSARRIVLNGLALLRRCMEARTA
jgi:RNA polymerase sigma factor (sigma-70 family)